MATVAEVYTLATLILSAELLAVLGYARRLRFRWLILAFFLNGLGCANHLQNLLSLPVLAALILAAVWRRPAKAYGLLVAAAAWSFGSLPYALLVIGDLAGGGGVRPTLQSALVGTWFSSVFNVLPTKSVLFTLAFFPLYNFPNLLLPLAVLGIWCARRLGLAPAIRVYLLGALALHALFVVRYSVSDQYTFFLPTYLLLTVLAGVGWRALEVCPSPAWRSAIRIAAAVLLLTTPLVYASAPALVRRTGLLNGVVADHPYDDAARRLLTPWSCTDRAVERATLHAYELAGRRGIILVEDLFQHAAGVKYYQDHAKMTDVLLRPLPKPDDQGRQQLASICDEAAHWRRTVVLMPAVRGVPPADPPGRHWRPDGDLYVLENRPATPSSPRR